MYKDSNLDDRNPNPGAFEATLVDLGLDFAAVFSAPPPRRWEPNEQLFALVPDCLKLDGACGTPQSREHCSKAPQVAPAQQTRFRAAQGRGTLP